MGIFGNKRSNAVDDTTSVDRAGDAEPTQQIPTKGEQSAAAKDAAAVRTPAASDDDATRPMAAVVDERTRQNPVTEAKSGGASAATERTRASFPEQESPARKPAVERPAAEVTDADADNEPTRVEPIPTKPLTGAGATTTRRPVAPAASTESDDDAEAERLAERAAERERRRAERDQALGTRRKAVDEDEAATPVVVKPKRTTDKFFGSLGLFLLRLVTAAIIGLHGLWKIMNLDKVEGMLGQTVIPEPKIMAMVLAASEIAIALGLLFGMLTRLAGLGLAAIGIGALVFVKWVKNPFNGYQLGGELELLLGAVGLLFLLLGAGGWSVDAAFRRRRAASKDA